MKVVQTASITGLFGSYVCAGFVSRSGDFVFIACISTIVGLFSSLSLGLMGSRVPEAFEDSSSPRGELKGLKTRAWMGAAIILDSILIFIARASFG